MKSFRLDIVTPDGQFYSGEAEFLSLRTISGEVGIMAGHADYLNALGMGEARVTINGETRRAACIGGMVSVTDGRVTVVATTFEWSDMIDLERAKNAEIRAREALQREDIDITEQKLNEARLKRALVRQSVAK
ncbi:MAG: ATP synthase F1 subunit epsilon [Clostridia bacterium]|nr:ATP synthase F1 subunit epsilon [Clostridia bacterium]MBR6499075.1 ATP synthase F1 subunit epsilon [Clostridia bacterium]